MVGKFSRSTELVIVGLTLWLIECGYRIAYWSWIAADPHADTHLATERVHFWLGAVLFSAFVLLYVFWRRSQNPSENTKAPTKKSSKSDVTAVP
jgi:hypothetical protein